MPFNSSIGTNRTSEPEQPQPTTIRVTVAGDTADEPPETVTFDWLAAKAREKGWSKFDCKINGEMIDEVDDFEVKAGDEVEITPYDAHG